MARFLTERSAFVHVGDQSTQGTISINSKANETFIIGAGFGRTGTSSMQIALAKLGWRTFHMREIRKNGAKCGEAVTKAGELKCALRQKKKDYDPSFKNYDQMVLSPNAFNWNDILNNPEYGTYHGTFDFPLCGMSCLTLPHWSHPYPPRYLYFVSSIIMYIGIRF